jgi:hypothetical protein
MYVSHNTLIKCVMVLQLYIFLSISVLSWIACYLYWVHSLPYTKNNISKIYLRPKGICLFDTNFSHSFARKIYGGVATSDLVFLAALLYDLVTTMF